MNEQLAWYLARASGIMAAALIALSVAWGLLFTTKVLNGRPRPAWLLDLHRFLGAAAVAFTALHVGGLVADNYVHFGVADLLVPFATDWHPAAVAWGVIALYLLLVIEVTSLFMRRLPRRVWHGVHLTSYLLFWLVAVHGATAGTDAGNRAYVWGSNIVIGLVLFLTVYRIVADRRAARAARTGRKRAERAPTEPAASDPALDSPAAVSEADEVPEAPAATSAAIRQ
jgi:DMSO/TMAO reductase YedYZ heme-binding membrane subunit